MASDPLEGPAAERSTGRAPGLLRLARLLVLGMILFSFGALLASIVLFPPSDPRTAVLGPNNNWTAEMTRAALDQLGWSPQAVAWFYAVLGWINAGVCIAVGLIVFRRKSDSWFGLYVALTFGALLTSSGASPLVATQGGTLLSGWYAVTGALSWQFTFILFYIFPDGRFVPAWTRWLLLFWVAGNLPALFASALNASLSLLLFGLVISAVGSQIYRYFRVSDALQRQQTKWIAFLGAVFLLLLPAWILTTAVLAPTRVSLATSLLASNLFNVFGRLTSLCLPIVIGISILRYRLWDIDIIIRRTLVYLPLTAILAGVFAASIRVLQTLFSPISGQSGTATALTTLIVVAAFDPVKGWLQKFVDARFKESSNPEGRWKAYDEQVRAFVQIHDSTASARRLLEEAVALFDAKDGAVYLRETGTERLAHSLGPLSNTPAFVVPLEHQGRPLGRLELGARRNGRPYSPHDRQLLRGTADAVAAAIDLVGVRTTNG